MSKKNPQHPKMYVAIISLRSYILIIFFILLLAFQAQAQISIPAQQKIDSLIEVADTLGKDPKKLAPAAKKILSLSEQANYSKGRVYGNFYLALSYYFANKYKTSISFLDKALEENKYLKTNPLLYADAHCLYGNNYFLVGLNPIAKQHYLKALQWANQEQENIATKEREIRNAYIGLIAMYYYSGRVDSARHYTNVFKNTTFEQEDRKTPYINVLYGNYHLDESRLDSAAYYYTQAYNHLKNTEEPYRILALHGLGQIAHRKENYKQALTYYKQILDNFRIIEAKTHILKHIFEIYRSLGNIQKEQEYLRSYTALRDSVSVTHKTERNSLLTKALTQADNQNRQETQHLISKTRFIIILSLGIFGILITFFYRKNKRQKKELQKKQQETQSLKKKVNTAFEEVAELAKKNDPSLLARFREVYPEIYQKLSLLEPSLTQSELGFCIMIWLGFSTKDIARYTYIEPKSVQMKKYRLRKKMNLSTGTNLYDWIKNL